uniref:Myeloid cell nuclear differentiation antigen n=1 Tax=Peromyscus maniculatus bairdii TaxID=230844 RepID=A0A8C8TH31_PERMB
IMKDVDVDDYQFRKIKSLLRQELKLTKKMQDDYDKIQLSDLMEDKFPEDAGLEKLTEVCQRIKELENLAKKLETERAKGNMGAPWTLIPFLPSLKVLAPCSDQNSLTGQWIYFQKRKSINREKTGVKKTKQSEGPDHSPCPEEATARCQSPELQTSSLASFNTSLAKVQTQIQSIARGAVLQKDAVTVMVLNAIDPFVYTPSEHGVKEMFHATYFHVKVFNINLKEKFTKKNVIIISNYFKFKGILEINEASSVFEAGPDQKIEVFNSLIRKASKPPQISDFHKYGPGAVIYGLFTLHKKKVNPKNTIYEIKDDDKNNIEVLGNGKWYNINCEEGDKFRLFCFQLKTIDKQLKLVCGDHSFIKVRSWEKKEHPLSIQAQKMK